jgi:hypothetical protein
MSACGPQPAVRGGAARCLQSRAKQTLGRRDRHRRSPRKTGKNQSHHAERRNALIHPARHLQQQDRDNDGHKRQDQEWVRCPSFRAFQTIRIAATARMRLTIPTRSWLPQLWFPALTCPCDHSCTKAAAGEASALQFLSNSAPSVQAMQADGLDRGEGYRPLGRSAAEKPDHRHRRLLHASRERPCRRCACEKHYGDL